RSTRFIASVTSWLPLSRMASTISCGEANFPVPVNRCESKTLSAIRNILAPCDNLKQQDLVAFIDLLMFPPLARQDLLIERQRRSRLQLAQRVEQGGNGEIVVARHRLIVKQNAHRGLHI